MRLTGRGKNPAGWVAESDCADVFGAEISGVRDDAVDGADLVGSEEDAEADCDGVGEEDDGMIGFCSRNTSPAPSQSELVRIGVCI